MASTQDPGELHEGRDGQRELYRLVNWLRRRVGSTTADADYWTSSDQTSLLPSSVNLGALTTGILQHTVTAGVSTPGVVTIGAGLTYATTTLDRAALTGDVSAAAGSNTTAFRSFAARSVLANATAGAAVPTELSSGTDGFVLRQSGTTLSFGTLGASSIPALDATFWTSSANADLANEVNLGALTDGTIQHTVTAGVSTPTAFAGTTGSIPFYAANSQLAQDNTNLFFNDATNALTLGGDLNLTRGSATSISKTGSGGLFIGTDIASTLTLYTNGTSRFTIDSTGALAVGNRFTIAAAGPVAMDTAGAITAGATLAIGTTSSNGDWILNATRSRNGGNYITVSNTSAGTSAQTGYIVTQSATSYTNYIAFTLQGTGFTTVGPVTANSSLYEAVNSTGAAMVFSAYSTGNIEFYTTTGYSQRFKIATGGDVSVNNLSAGGVVYATNATGVLKIGTSAEVASAITWPAAGRVLVSSGATTAPVGDTLLNYDTVNDFFLIGTGAQQRWYNLGASGDANTELVSALWNANVFTLLSAATGTGTTRAIKIDADTANLSLEGAEWSLTSTDITMQTSTPALLIDGNGTDSFLSSTDWDNWSIQTIHGTLMACDDAHATVQGSIDVASAAGAVLDGIKLVADAEVSGTTTITTATGFNHVVIPRPGISKLDAGGLTVSFSASLYIANAPLAGTDVTITNPYAVWSDAGLNRFDGNGTYVFELPADATAGVGAISGRIPVLIGGATRYLRYFPD